MEQENEEKKEKITDAMIIAEWRSMIQMFKDIVKDMPKIEDVKDDLTELMELSKNSARLTPKQREGIHERCANYLNGTYGKGLSHIK